MAREIGAVAPVLPRAEEEDLNAGLPAFLIDGEQIRFRQRLRIDPLMPLYLRQCADAVAIDSGAFEVERARGLLHIGHEFLLRAARAAAQKRARRSEEHTSELQSLMRISYAVFCLKKQKKQYTKQR